MWYFFPRLCLCSVQIFFFVCGTPHLFFFFLRCSWLYRRRWDFLQQEPWNTSQALWRGPVVSCCGGLAIMAQEANSWDPGSIPSRDTSFDDPESSCLLSGPGLQWNPVTLLQFHAALHRKGRARLSECTADICAHLLRLHHCALLLTLQLLWGSVQHTHLRTFHTFNRFSAIWRIYPSSKWSSQWPCDGYVHHGWMTSCGRGRDSATPERFGRGSRGMISVRSSKLSLFFPELCPFRRFFASCPFEIFGAKRSRSGAFGFDDV